MANTDDMALTQAERVRESRGALEFVFNLRLGETYEEALDLKGNPTLDMDWYEKQFKGSNACIATLSPTGARRRTVRNHLKKVKKDDAAKLIRSRTCCAHHAAGRGLSLIPGRQVIALRCRTSAWTSRSRDRTAKVEYRSISCQLVFFCVERWKAWRMLQSKAGIENREDKAQR